MKILTESLEQRLKEFHRKYGHYESNHPTTDIPQEVKTLRLSLIVEEFGELRKAILEDDLEEVADAAADLVYVIVGTCVAYGIPFDRVFTEIHSSNMTKTALKVENQGQKYGRGNPKGPNYIAPQLGVILFSDLKTDLETQK